MYKCLEMQRKLASDEILERSTVAKSIVQKYVVVATHAAMR
jgi:hypothetical protein